jgi:hypothetical protein
MPLQYHAGQIEVQCEANTRPVAEMLAGWVGPVGEFVRVADLIFLAVQDDAEELRFIAVSGKAPLIEVSGGRSIRFPGLTVPVNGGQILAGGLAISLAQLRRARVNGMLVQDPLGWTLEAHEAFTNCRKYVAPSIAVDDAPRYGPSDADVLPIDDGWLARVVGTAETSFLASISPDGQPDVSHRGGRPGFLRFDPAAARLEWDEYVGDGMLKSAGNVRATGSVTLLVLDIASGDAAEITGAGTYRTLRTLREARSEALEQHGEHYPIQGAMEMRITGARRIRSLVAARRRVDRALRITSRSSPDDQAPQ